MRLWSFFFCAAILSSLTLCPAQAGLLGDASQAQPRFVTLPARGVNPGVLQAQAAASMTVPFFRSTVKSPLDGKTYSYEMVGTNPFTTRVSTTVKYVPILVRIHWADGTVLDPTKAGCGDSESVSQRLFGSPLFNHIPLSSNGVSVGDTQVTDAFQRQFLDVGCRQQLSCAPRRGCLTPPCRRQCAHRRRPTAESAPVPRIGSASSTLTTLTIWRFRW